MDKTISLAALKRRLNRNTVYISTSKGFSTAPQDGNKSEWEVLKWKLSLARQPFEEISDFGWSESGVVLALDRPRLETYLNLAYRCNTTSILFVPAQKDSDFPCIFEIFQQDRIAHICTVAGELPNQFTPLTTDEVLQILRKIKNSDNWQTILLDPALRLRHLKNELVKKYNAFNGKYGEHRNWYHWEPRKAWLIDWELHLEKGLKEAVVDPIQADYKNLCAFRETIQKREQEI